MKTFRTIAYASVAVLASLSALVHCGSSDSDDSSLPIDAAVIANDSAIVLEASAEDSSVDDSGINGGDSEPSDGARPLPFITLSADKSTLVDTEGRPFVPYGFNYDHDWDGKQIEDYWVSDWARVVGDFNEMRDLGATTVRIHLDIGAFMVDATHPNEAALNQLDKLLALAEENKIYLDLTGLANYRSADVLAWYDNVDEAGRWAAQATFWKAVAARGAKSPAVLAYDLLNEPSVPGAATTDWRFGVLGTNLYGQYLTRDPAGRAREAIAKEWMHTLYAAIRTVDPKHLVTLGNMSFLTGAFPPAMVASELDYLSVHLYPASGEVAKTVDIVKAFRAAGRPVVVEETYVLQSGPAQLDWFFRDALPYASGYLGFYWGKSVADLTPPATFGDAFMLSWLDVFVRARSVVVTRTPANSGVNEFTSPNDRLLLTDDVDASAIGALGYTFNTAVGRVLRYNPGDAIPLCEFYSSSATDRLYTTTCTPAPFTDAGYDFQKVLGWAYASPDAGNAPLYRYYNTSATQHAYSITKDDARFADAGFTYQGVEAYLP